MASTGLTQKLSETLTPWCPTLREAAPRLGVRVRFVLPSVVRKS